MLQSVYALRTKQTHARGSSRHPGDLTNVQVNSRYAPWLGRELHCWARSLELPPTARPHDLRSVYGSLCHLLFTQRPSFNRTLMLALGHCTLKDSLAYGTVELGGGVDELRGRLGPLPISPSNPSGEVAGQESEF